MESPGSKPQITLCEIYRNELQDLQNNSESKFGGVMRVFVTLKRGYFLQTTYIRLYRSREIGVRHIEKNA